MAQRHAGVRGARRAPIASGPCGPTAGGSTVATFVVFRAFVIYATAGVPGHALLRRAVPLAVLLAVPRRLRRGLVRLRPAVRVVAALAGAAHPDLPARLPDDLLLLPQGLLPVVLAVARRPAPSPSRTAKYTGETRLPLILQNIHRYFFYAACWSALILTYDGVLAFRDEDGRVGPHGPRHADPARQRRAASGSTRCPATRAGTSSAAGSGTSPSTRCATGRGPWSRS